MTTSPYDDLPRREANHQPLVAAPLPATRGALVRPDKIAIIHGDAAAHLCGFLCQGAPTARFRIARQRAIGKNDTVAALLLNTPAMLEAHYGVPMAGGVLNALNTRLDAATLAFILDHGEAKVLLVDSELSPLAAEALTMAKATPTLVEYADPESGVAPSLGAADYEDFIASGDPDFVWAPPGDEWDAIALNYTSGTTGDPKGVVYHHRGSAFAGDGQCAARADGGGQRLSLDAADVPLQRLVLPLDDLRRDRNPCLSARRAGRRDV